MVKRIVLRSSLKPFSVLYKESDTLEKALLTRLKAEPPAKSLVV